MKRSGIRGFVTMLIPYFATLHTGYGAAETFSDKHSSCIDDPDHSHDEERYLLFGMSSKGNYLVVSFTERSGIIRIISARQMTRQERNAYEQ